MSRQHGADLPPGPGRYTDIIDGPPGRVGYFKAPFLTGAEVAAEFFEQIASITRGLFPRRLIVRQFFAYVVRLRF